MNKGVDANGAASTACAAAASARDSITCPRRNC